MKTLRLFTWLVLLNLFSPTAISGESEGTAFTNAFIQVESAITNQLHLFDGDTNVDHLVAAYKMASSLDGLGLKGKAGREDYLTKRRLKLLIADKCFSARDKTYDPTNPPRIVGQVLPPLLTGKEYPGMPPSEIRDPHARQEYERAIAENAIKDAKQRREMKLHRIVARAISDGRFLIEQSRFRPEWHTRVLTTLTNAVHQPEMRRMLIDPNFQPNWP